MRECHITKLEDSPAFTFNLVCGDSLLYRSLGAQQQVLGFHELAHAYQSEDLPELQRILKPGSYHAVVANPPYITVKDRSLDQAYRHRYPQVCYRQYSLAVPFMQRLFHLACENGFTGQITANSFMKREFGKKLVESYLPTIDLTHVVDTGGAYIPGHGTPTVILFGRNRRPVAPVIRAVMGIKGEPSTPHDPSQGLVWTAITQQIDQVCSQSVFISVNDTPREQFGKHPWSIGGGGAAELKDLFESAFATTLAQKITAIGRGAHTGEDDAYVMPKSSLLRHLIPESQQSSFVTGDVVRDWQLGNVEWTVFPYDAEFDAFGSKLPVPVFRHLWHFREQLWNRVEGAGTHRTIGLTGTNSHVFTRNGSRDRRFATARSRRTTILCWIAAGRCSTARPR
ncbi:MAG: BREX-2 system adenine-specific DNA-methyltransferase PglX [Planctomycetota bacterium]|nr:BREX-2 system adenine-specific DNA-methyltransferase PglX [Planctomycetota bacterium]